MRSVSEDDVSGLIAVACGAFALLAALGVLVATGLCVGGAMSDPDHQEEFFGAANPPPM